MTIKHLSAFVALGALSLVVACSSGTGGVVPSQPGTSPEAVHPAGQTAVGSADADAAATRADAIANTASPIKVKPEVLAFKKIGASEDKHFTIGEAKYKGSFRVTKSCKAQIDVSPTSVDGPHASIDVTPVKDVARCVITVSDTHKNKAVVDVSVDTKVGPTAPPTSPSPSASPSTGPSTGPSSSPSGAPSTSPSPTTSPTTAPTATPTTGPTSTPVTGVIANGNFATGTLSGWTTCSVAHPGYAAAVNASAPPAATGAQTSSAALTSSPGANGVVASPPPNYNPNITATAPPLGSYVAQAGDMSSETAGAAGICQQIQPDATNHYLSFWAYEGGTGYNFAYGDQEADILDSTGTTVDTTLFAEENCFYYPSGGIGAGSYTASGCWPQALGGGSAYTDWANGGYWVQRGPYDLTAYEGTTVTLFLGVWEDSTHAGPTSYGNGMLIGNVQLTSTNTFPTTFSARHRAAVKKPTIRGARITRPPSHP